MNLPSHLLLSGAFADAFACLCLVQHIAAGKEPPKWRLENIEITVNETLTNLRVAQEEMTKCAPSS